MPRAKKRKGHGVHHWDFAHYSLQLEVFSRNGFQSTIVLIKESDDEDDLSLMATHLYPWLPENCKLELIDEKEDSHYNRVIGRWHGKRPKSPERNHRYEWVEDDE